MAGESLKAYILEVVRLFQKPVAGGTLSVLIDKSAP